MRAAEIASSIGSAWPAVHQRLGIPAEYLRNKHGPCLICGGKDRYRYDNKLGRGDYFCNQCGAGDGFSLLQRFFGWDFNTARARVIEAAGLDTARVMAMATTATTVSIAQPTQRVRRLKREACALVNCKDAIDYLTSRGLWPIAMRTSLRAHAGCEYFEDGAKIGRYPALLAAVRDIDGELVSIHCTYLDAGRKLAGHEPRKLLSPLTGREGCAVRLQPITGDQLGVGEGIESCLSAGFLHRVPTWAALNTSLLAKFTPPAEVRRLVVFADNDAPGIEAASHLRDRLSRSSPPKL